MFTDSSDYFMNTMDRHLYTNDCYSKPKEIHEAKIERTVIDPEETLSYVIKKYNLKI